MIVTCPGCDANYRVRNEAVPDDGARMRCPRCGTIFLAVAPGPGKKDQGESHAPAPVTGLFEAFDETSSAPPSPTGPQQGPAAPAPSMPFTPPPSTPGSAGARHQASTSMEQLLGGSYVGGGQPAPLPEGDLFPRPPTGSFPPQPSTGNGPSGPFQAGAGHDPRSGQPPPQVAITDDADDPFAKLDLDQPRRPPEPSGPRLTTIDEDVELATRGGGPDGRRVARAPHLQTTNDAAGSAGKRRSSTAGPWSPSPAEAPSSGPSLGAYVLSWVLVALGAVTLAAGGVFSVWTAGVVDLDEPLMPLFEEKAGVRPPRSALGKDDVPVDRIRALAERRERVGDLVGAATAWRRVLAHGEDAEAKKHLDDLLAKLGHAGLL